MLFAKTRVLVCMTGIFLLERTTEAGYCYRTSACSTSSQRSTSYTTACGWFNWLRCTRYRNVYYTSYYTCYSSYCCSGYTGSSCSQPMCHGSTSCPNGGTCSAPGHCSCLSGFSGSSCTDTNECQLGTHNCDHTCTNTHGSFTCSCRPGYTLQSDRNTCTDNNECQLGTHNCDHTCTNTNGSFTCACRPGYTLQSDRKTCTDNDECSSNNGGCSLYCRNLNGSYECYCKDGLILADDRKTCIDDDECSDNNGDCAHVCVNEHGTHRCKCYDGHQLDTDRKACTDIDECQGTSKCSHFCHNTNGSYNCSCEPGYELDVDGNTCLDIDDCIGIACSNGGICIDGTESYSCQCTQGYEGKHCETDINECVFANGGCEDQCVNTDGAFYCQCRDNTFLEDDGASCRGDSSRPTVFDTYNISRRLLPRGCAYITLVSCKGIGTDSQIELTSTSPWYQLKTNQSILYSFGIIFAEIKDLSIPVSITGMTVISTLLNFELTIGSSMYRENEGTEQTDYYNKDCLLFDITPKDVHDFVTSGSFLSTMFDRLNFELPSWLQFSKSGVGMISVTDLRTDFVVGNKIDNFYGCRGAPVFNDRLYSVFSFGADTSFSIYGKRFNIPSPLEGNKFCLIVDICHNNGGTVFLMLPPESRNLLDNMDLFSTTLKSLRLRPKGIGMSLSKDINVHSKTSEMILWNGDQIFRYPVFRRGSVWFGTDVEYKVEETDFSLQVHGETDIFLGVPNLSSLLLDIFVEEWNSLVQLNKFTFTPTIQFPVFGKTVTVTFRDIVTASLDIYLSVGGVGERMWCGDGANPPGIFASFLATVNPFKSIPIISDWDMSVSSQIYAFITTEKQLSVDTKINVTNDIIELKDIIQRLMNLVTFFLAEIRDNVSQAIKGSLSDFSNAVTSLKTLLHNTVIGETRLINALNVWRDIWKVFSSDIKNSATRVYDMLEFESSMLPKNLSKLLEFEVTRMGRNINLAVSRIRSQILSLVDKYTGFGFRMAAFVKILSLEFSLMDIEIVYSINNLGRCSKFQKVYEIMKGEAALKVLARSTYRKKIGYFFMYESNGLLSIALNININKFVGHIHVHVSILGLKVSGDLLLSNNGIYIAIEGNIWNIFFARVEMSAELGKKWHDLTFNVKGALVVSTRQESETNSISSDFQGSYLDGLRLLAQKMAETANDRLQAVQNRLSAAQVALSVAQNKITGAQRYVRSCNSKFDDAINGLEHAKNKLERAKGPFEEALKKLRQAQRNVDNLCRIKTCHSICVPGVYLSRCGGWFRYPCLKWTNCMFRIPNVFCEFANLACWAVRGLAYAALEVAKIFVRIPMLIFDAAKVALSIAQIVVDRARIVLWVAEGLLEIAKIGLEVAKIGLEVAKGAIEIVKFTVRAALHVFNLLVSGIQKLIDVKNCGFELQMSTTDRAFFHVSCDVQAFGLGWKTFWFEFDFRHPITSMLQMAKATLGALFESITNLLGKRKKRDLSFSAETKLHHVLHLYKREVSNDTNLDSIFLNTSSFVNATDQGSDTTNSYNARVLLFKKNCELFQNVHTFLLESINTLFGMCNETVATMKDVPTYKNLVTLINDSSSNNMTAESLEISQEYALTDYNITSEDLDTVLDNLKVTLPEVPLMKELEYSTIVADAQVEMELIEANSIKITEYWITGMENMTATFFDETECSTFEDCILYAFSVLYDLFSDESLGKSEINRRLTSSIEDMFLTFILNATMPVTSVYELTTDVIDDLINLNTSHMLCSTAPEITPSLSNITVLVESNIEILCIATGNPLPQIKWYYNDEILEGENKSKFGLTNASKYHEGAYRCRVENVVAEIYSSEAFIKIEECQPGTYFFSESCIKCSKGQYQLEWNQRACISCPDGYSTTEMGSKSDNDCYDTQTFIIPVSTGLASGLVVILAVVTIFYCIRRRNRNIPKKRPPTATTTMESINLNSVKENLSQVHDRKTTAFR